jgi:hypothetical protein
MFVFSGLQGAELREAAVWFASVLVIVVGFRFFREVIVLVLEKLHELFIQQNPLNL